MAELAARPAALLIYELFGSFGRCVVLDSGQGVLDDLEKALIDASDVPLSCLSAEELGDWGNHPEGAP